VDAGDLEQNVNTAGSELILDLHNGVDDVWTLTERANRVLRASRPVDEERQCCASIARLASSRYLPFG
jgi:hypothetical protein